MDKGTQTALFEICKKYDDLLLVDVMNHLHRFMWVHQDMSVAIGDDIVCTGHIFGFTKFILYLKDKFPNCAIVLALDGRDGERKEFNPDYKGNRDKSYRVDKEMKELIDMCGLVDGIFTCYDSSKEADDAIYAISKKVGELCTKNSLKKNVYILSNDKDMFQCVTDKEECPVRIIRKFGSGKDWFSGSDLVDYEKAKEKFEGVAPEKLAIFRALTGDASDNLKGYPRFRKKNAAILSDVCRVTESGLVFDTGVTVVESWNSIVSVVNSEYSRFWSNYNIMKLKDFDFELSSINSESMSVRESAESVVKYKLGMYKMGLCRLSPYKRELFSMFSEMGF